MPDTGLNDPLSNQPGQSWPVCRGGAGRCARTGEPRLIADVDVDPDYVPGNSYVRSEYLVPDAAQPPETLVAMADRALYSAKLQGRNCVQVHPPGH